MTEENAIIDELEAEQQIKELNISAADAKKMIQLKEDIISLTQNPLWERVINQAYFKDESYRLVLLRAEQEVLEDDKKRQSVDNQITAIGEFWQWLRERVQLGNMALKTLAAAEEAKNEIEDSLTQQSN